MKQKKGFTLMELLVSIVLLSVVGGIIIYNMSIISKTNKETEYKRFVATVKSAANVYSELKSDAFNQLYSDKSYIVITVEDLIESGLLDGDLTNPYTGNTPSLNEEIIAYLDPETGALEFIYPIEINNEGSSTDTYQDEDKNGIPDTYKEIDSNGDGKVDGWDTTGDGKINAYDTNNDGIPDAFDTNGDGKIDAWDTDYDGIPDAFDTDGDEKIDAWDTNGDGVYDSKDSDKDGIPDHYKKIDSNKDGIPDGWDTNGDGKIDAWDTNGDGIPDAFDKDLDGKADAYDTDNTGLPNSFDEDHNGIPDHYKAIDSNNDGKIDGWDTNGDGKIDAWDTNGDSKPDAFDTNKDGKVDAYDTNNDATPDVFDKNYDGVPDYYKEIDTNNDGKIDGWDTTGDGKIDAWDTNNDGIPDAFDTNGDGKADAYDTNNDGMPDTFDTNKDGKIDAWDTNHDGIADQFDTNNDGVADEFDQNYDGKIDAWDKDLDGKIDAWDTTGDGKANLFDKDNDGIPDSYKKIDSNGDGKTDGWDTNGDEKIDAWDTNNDGIPDAFDTNGDGIADAYDTNNDSIPDVFGHIPGTTGATVNINSSTGSSSGTESGGSSTIEGPSSLVQGIREKEVFLAAMSDYVVYGENYNCMQGAGSYELALSKDDGTLIMLDNEENVKKYNFECSLPTDFDPKTPKAYRVNYSWITETGKKRNATRTLRVLAQVKPTVTFNDKNYKAGDWYTPTYDSSSKKWKYLTYTPKLEGMEPDDAVIRITKESRDPAGNKEKVTNNPSNNDFVNDFIEYVADDGDKTYYLETIVYGHHDKNYSYIASGDVNIKQQLVIPTSLVTNIDNGWNTNKTFTINETYSKVGVSEYEYKLSNSNTKPTKTNHVEKLNSFAKQDNSTSKSLTIYNNSCSPKEIQYQYLFVRAINNDGHIGEWSDPIDISLTNQLDLIIDGDSKRCSNNSACCKPNGNTCYYDTKSKYLSFGDTKMIILGRDSTGKVITAYDGLQSNRVTPTAIKNDIAYVKTCDGIYTVNYSFSSPMLNVITNEAQNFLKTLPSNYSDYIQYRSWLSNYTAYVGVPSKNDFDLYKSALADSKPYWTSTTYQTSFQIYVHYAYNTRYNTYFYAVDGNKLSSAYAGASAYVKPMLSFKTSYVCSGDGTSNNPYKLAY